MFEKLFKKGETHINSKQQTVYKELENSLYLLLHNKCGPNSKLRVLYQNDTKIYLCLNDLIEYIIYEEDQIQQYLNTQNNEIMKTFFRNHNSRIHNYCKHVRNCSEFNVLVKEDEKQYILTQTNEILMPEIQEDQEESPTSIYKYSPSVMPPHIYQMIAEDTSVGTFQNSDTSTPLSIESLRKFNEERELKEFMKQQKQKQGRNDDCQSSVMIYHKYDKDVPDNNQLIESYVETTFYIKSSCFIEALDIIMDLLIEVNRDPVKKMLYLHKIGTLIDCYRNQKLFSYLEEKKQFKKLHKKWQEYQT